MEQYDACGAPVQQRRRRRPALACERCRQRKVKCDRNAPCTQCIRTRCEPCTYVPDDHPARNRRSEVDHCQAGTTSVTTTSTAAAGALTRTTSTTTVDEPPAIRPPDVWRSTHHPASTSTTLIEDQHRAASIDSAASPVIPPSSSSVQALENRVHELERKLLQSVNSRSAEPPAGSSRSDDADLPVRGTYCKTRLFGQGHWRSSVQQVRSFL
jgi:hypothetical protein